MINAYIVRRMMKEKINVKKRRQTADLEQVKQELKKSQAFLNSLIEQIDSDLFIL